VCLVTTAWGQTALDEQIDRAIEEGVKGIWATQLPHGGFSDPNFKPTGPARHYTGDKDVMAMIVLAYAGEDPLKNPKMKEALKVLLEIEITHTYTLGFRVITLAELCRRTEDRNFKSSLRAVIRHDVDQLLAIQRKDNGGWSYDQRTGAWSWDFSNTQLAVLALGEAVKVGIEVPAEAFQRVLQLYLQEQLDDGGWNYGNKSINWGQIPAYGSMTAAATASLFIIRDVLNPGQGCPCKSGKSGGRRDRSVEKAITGGVSWLGQHFTPKENARGGPMRPYYWLYAAERVGQHTGLKYFGDHDWYQEGAKHILETGRNYSWGTFDRTSFALLFLIKGRGPILMNKLMYDGRWDLHPYDAANLADYVTRIKEQRFNWQVIHLGIPVEEMHDAPILYITAEEAIAFSDEHKKKLREFTDTGGTLLLEASCGNKAADSFWRTLCREVWPEWELTFISREHPLWTADLEIGGRTLPSLHGISDGLRTFVFYSPQDISCQWHTKATARGENLFQLGNNLYAYSTDRARIRTRFHRRRPGVGPKYADQKIAPVSGDDLKVARVKLGSGWQLNSHYRPWAMLGADLKEAGGPAIAELEPLDSPDQAAGGTADVIYLCGRGDMTPSDATAAALRTYLQQGGFLIAEAALGDAAYDRAFRAMAQKMGLTLTECGPEHPLLSGDLGAAGRGYGIGKVEFTHALRERQIGASKPTILELRLGDRVVGVYSPLDLMFAQTGCAAFGSRGYDAADARALAVNVTLMAAGHRSAAGR
jgi:hypothetical protein